MSRINLIKLDDSSINNWKFGIGPVLNNPEIFEYEIAIDNKHKPLDIVFTDYRYYKTEVKIPYNIYCQHVKQGNLNIEFEVDGTAKVFINNKKIKEFKNYCSVRLPGNIMPGDTIRILVSICNEYRVPNLLNAKFEIDGNNKEEREFVEDISISLHTASKLLYWDTLQKSYFLSRDFKIDNCKYDKKELISLRKVFKNNIKKLRIDSFKKGDKKEFFKSAKDILNNISPIAEFSKEYTLFLDSNAHIDMAWLWRWKESKEITRGTFKNVLKMMKKYPDLVFTHSQACSYKWIEELEPKIINQIKEKIKDKKWEVIGGMWVEPDCNLIDGESWVRQILYGTKYFKEQFDLDMKIGWNVDSFGYNWNMPQFYSRSKIKYFITQKLNWNERTIFPYHIFWWEAPDGSRILTYFPYEGYCIGIEPYSLVNSLKMFEVNTGLKDMLVLYGIGDHGGGPNEEMLEQVEKLKKITIYPEVKFSRADEYMNNLDKLLDINKLPVWKDELYVESHQGTYTVQAKMKYQNRKSEILLTEAEKFASVANLYGLKYPKKEFENSWKKALFNQFHDILPGSSIAGVYRDTEEDYLEIKDIVEKESKKALSVLSSNINTSKLTRGIPFVVYNSLNWSRNSIVSVDLPSYDNTYTVLDKDGKEMLSQINQKEIMFFAENVPSIGYATYQLSNNNLGQSQLLQSSLKAGKYWLENKYLKVEISENTGNIKRIYDKENKKEVLNGQANQLQLLEDKPTFCETWNVGWTGKVFCLDKIDSIEILEAGPLRAIIRVKKSFKGEAKHKYYGTGFMKTPGVEYPSSFFIQDIILYNDTREVIISSDVDWWEDRLMLKASFPVNVRSDKATYEIPYSYIQRTTNPKTEQEKAKIEVSMLKWMDISEPEYGVSIINDSKYGGDIKGNAMRLSLLRSPALTPYYQHYTPDPSADRGKHKFSYSIYPHKGTFKEARTIRKAYEFNYPVNIFFTEKHTGKLAPNYSFVKTQQNNVLISAIKQDENTDDLILRCLELYGTDTTAVIEFDRNIKKAVKVNLLEEDEEDLKVDCNKIIINLKKFEISTIKLSI